mmetsp:Transcript_24129/g.53726  ORF Transcript_24129/g.53726 Transcript_24129/m.53726 type:complete len:281 (-) Transcript_24129:472-1314(-)
MQSSQPSCLSIRDMSVSLKKEPSLDRGLTSVDDDDDAGGDDPGSIGSRSRLPTSSGVPRWGQELATQWTAEPSLEAISRRSIPAAVTATISPGEIRVLGATTIHSSALVVPSKTPATSFWAAETTMPKRWDLLPPEPLPPRSAVLVAGDGDGESSRRLSSEGTPVPRSDRTFSRRSFRCRSISFWVWILRLTMSSGAMLFFFVLLFFVFGFGAVTTTGGVGVFGLACCCCFCFWRSSSRCLTASRSSSASLSSCFWRSSSIRLTWKRRTSASLRIWRSRK